MVEQGRDALTKEMRREGLALARTWKSEALAAEVEWLLQVLNDVRVGSWLALGEPERGQEPAVTAQNARYLLALELCGLFQSVLLAALGVSELPEWLGD